MIKLIILFMVSMCIIILKAYTIKEKIDKELSNKINNIDLD